MGANPSGMRVPCGMMHEQMCKKLDSPSHLAFTHLPAYALVGLEQHGYAYVRPVGEEQDGGGGVTGGRRGSGGSDGRGSRGGGGGGDDGGVPTHTPFARERREGS